MATAAAELGNVRTHPHDLSMSMVNALLSNRPRNNSRTFASVHSIYGDICAINDAIIAQHVNILRREVSNGSVGSDRE